MRSKSKPVDRAIIESIFNDVCSILEENPIMVKSKCRKKELVLCRSIAAYVIKALTRASLTEIGKFLGGRNHATIIENLYNVSIYFDTEDEFFMKKWEKYISSSLIWNNKKVA